MWYLLEVPHWDAPQAGGKQGATTCEMVTGMVTASAVLPRKPLSCNGFRPQFGGTYFRRTGERLQTGGGQGHDSPQSGHAKEAP